MTDVAILGDYFGDKLLRWLFIVKGGVNPLENVDVRIGNTFVMAKTANSIITDNIRYEKFLYTFYKDLYFVSIQRHFCIDEFFICACF